MKLIAELSAYLGFFLLAMTQLETGVWVYFGVSAIAYWKLSKVRPRLKAWLWGLFWPGIIFMPLFRLMDKVHASDLAQSLRTKADERRAEQQICSNCGHAVSWFSRNRMHPGMFARSPCEKQGKYCVPVDYSADANSADPNEKESRQLCSNCGHAVSWFSRNRMHPGMFARSPCEKQGKYCVPVD